MYASVWDEADADVDARGGSTPTCPPAVSLLWYSLPIATPGVNGDVATFSCVDKECSAVGSDGAEDVNSEEDEVVAPRCCCSGNDDGLDESGVCSREAVSMSTSIVHEPFKDVVG